MAFHQKVKLAISLGSLLLAFAPKSFGFALLGPYPDWMQRTNGYHQPGDIGGPMDIGEGYRWNVPVITYGFDQSFLDYFGSNGVTAVEGAIQILNDLPPASGIVLTNFPTYAAGYNYAAQAEQLFDLKSVTLSLLLEQMGLAQPQRNIFDLLRFDPILMRTDESTWPTGTIPNLIIERNFDPETLLPSHYVNGNIFYGVAGVLFLSSPGSNLWDIFELTVDPGSEDSDSAVADWRSADPSSGLDQPSRSMLGIVLRGLTQDDAGGIRYLLNTNTVQLETLLPDVHGTGTNASTFVNLALRPGIEKVTFLRQQVDPNSGQPIPVTNQFTDTYISNNTAMHQSLERIVTQPDFLFSAAELGVPFGAERGYSRTGTSNWWNSAGANTNQTGPGVIRPQVKITFGKRGPLVQTTDNAAMVNGYQDFRWASFDESAAPPIVYPESTTSADANGLKVHLNLVWAASASQMIWQIPATFGSQVALQASTNLADWVSVATVTNRGGPVDWFYWYPQQPARFFRAVPQSN